MLRSPASFAKRASLCESLSGNSRTAALRVARASATMRLRSSSGYSSAFCALHSDWYSRCSAMASLICADVVIRSSLPSTTGRGVGLVVPVVELVFQRFLQYLAPFFGREGLRQDRVELPRGSNHECPDLSEPHEIANGVTGQENVPAPETIAPVSTTLV